VLIRPDDLEVRHCGRRYWRKRECGDDAEVACPRPAQPPEEIRRVVLIAFEHLPVCEHDLGGKQVVERKPIRAPEKAETAAEGEPRDPDRRTSAGGDRETVLAQPLAQLTGARAGTDPHHTVGDADLAHWRDVDHGPPSGREASKAVAAASRSDLEAGASGELDRRSDVSGHRAAHDRLRLELVEAGDERPARPFVLLRSGQQHRAG
jgi:hypothetical protein